MKESRQVIAWRGKGGSMAYNYMKKRVKFYWASKYKVWEVSGKTDQIIINKCFELCNRYHAIHFEVLD